MIRRVIGAALLLFGVIEVVVISLAFAFFKAEEVSS